MALPAKKSENLTILEEIYDQSQAKKPPQKKVKEYFQDSKRIERLLSGGIIFFGLAALVLGFFQFKHNLNRSFTPQEKSPVSLGESGLTASQDLLGLSQKDTDIDGLSDYDELYVHGTSPYLADSDSDGTSDQKEIGQSTDPNCPPGQNCFALWGVDVSGSDQTQTSLDSLLLTDQLQGGQLRQLLIQAGMSESELAQFNDTELLAAYQEALNQNQAESAAASQAITLPVGSIS